MDQASMPWRQKKRSGWLEESLYWLTSYKMNLQFHGDKMFGVETI